MLISQPTKCTVAAILGFLIVAINFPSLLAGQGTLVEDPPRFEWSEQTDDNGQTYFSGVMEIGEATFVIGGETLTTRAYRQAGGSYTIPGPTMEMKPGNKYVLSFHNTLPYEPLSPDHNVFKDPNVSNLHTHGLHISGESPGDDVTRSFEGGFGGDFVYDIPADHMGGTYWYHAHHHGSTFLQVSGGAFGLLIVDDSADGIPANVAAMEERKIVLGFLDPNSAGTGGDTLISGTLSPTWTVNGLVGGNINAQPETWQHWRMLVADRNAKEKLIEFGPNCEVVLLARDGVWRTSAPKRLSSNSISLTGASRADFAVRVWGDSQLMVDGDVVATITATQETPDLTVHPFAPDGVSMWSALRPFYLRDLRNENNVNFDSISMGARTINGGKFDAAEPTFAKTATGVQEWSISGATNHPFHLHIYHVQTLSNTNDFEAGEYYDTIATNTDVRFDLSPSTAYEGRAIMHCHILAHEDRGAMGWMDVIGGIGRPEFPVDSNTSYAEYYSLDAPVIPDAPSNLQATAASSSSIDLTWVDNSSNEDGFDIEWSLDGNLFDYLASVGPDVVNYTDTGLMANTTYFYRVIAYNAAGDSSPSNVANATTLSGGDPTSVEVGSIMVTTVNVGRGDKIGRAVVVVVDNLGNPVEGATVIGDFSGDIVETPSIPLTDATGTTTIDTNGTARGGVSLTFCVTGISHPILDDFVGEVCGSN